MLARELPARAGAPVRRLGQVDTRLVRLRAAASALDQIANASLQAAGFTALAVASVKIGGEGESLMQHSLRLAMSSSAPDARVEALVHVIQVLNDTTPVISENTQDSSRP